MSSGARRPLVAGNWKLHHGREAACALAREVVTGVATIARVDVVIAPVFTVLDAVQDVLEGSSVGLAAQDVHHSEQGAFTGEVAPAMLREVGCTHCIVGHSERRQLFGETDEGVRKKTAALLARGLTPIVCIGETLAEREAGKTLEVVLGQLDAALAGLDAGQVASVVLAYEPVWAIGTGKVAKASDAQEVHAAIRARLEQRFDKVAARAVRILYGGSVKPDNALELIREVDIDGALVGGASLEAKSFLAIVRAASESMT